MKSKVKVLIIDPWYIQYSEEMIKELKKNVDLTLATKHNIRIDRKDISLINIYFRISDKLHSGLLRKAIRLLEYIYAWAKIIKLIHGRQFDVIHIQWLLHYKTDIYFLKKVKKYASMKSIKLVYTAHNDMPHVNGNASIEALKRIYNFYDTIIVHGEDTKKKIKSIVPELNNFYTQRFGAYTSKEIISIDKEKINTEYYNKIEKCKGKIVLLFGNIYFNKGFDRIMRYWYENNDKLNDHLLIIAGPLRETNDKYKRAAEEIETLDNVIYCPQYINKSEHDYFFLSADIVVLPYRQASMSAVIFTAVQFYKTVLATKVGCIPDYINSENAFLVENDDDSIYRRLDEIINTPKSRLAEMGNKLNSEIISNCDWGNICEKLIDDVYES